MIKPTFNTPQEALRYHVAKATERGGAIIEIPALNFTLDSVDGETMILFPGRIGSAPEFLTGRMRRRDTLSFSGLDGEFCYLTGLWRRTPQYGRFKARNADVSKALHAVALETASCFDDAWAAWRKPE